MDVIMRANGKSRQILFVKIVLKFRRIAYQTLVCESAHPRSQHVRRIVQMLDELERMVSALHSPMTMIVRTVLGVTTFTAGEFWARLERDPVGFWMLTGETPATLSPIVDAVHLPALLMTKRDMVLMTFIWLRQYPTLQQLSDMFSVRLTTLWQYLRDTIIALHVLLAREVQWPTPDQWQQLRGTCPHFPNFVAYADCTIIRISRPLGNQQRRFYRGDKKCHFVNSFVVTDTSGRVVFWKAGFAGHMADAICFRHSHMPALPAGLEVLVDSVFPNEQPLLTPLAYPLNPYHSRQRVSVEHHIGRLKVYRCLGTRRFRGRRQLIPILCNIVAALCNRKLQTVASLRADFYRITS